MVWLVAAVVLILPFVLLRFQRHPAGRMGLGLFWLGCLGAGAWFLYHAREAKRDLDSVRTYALPDSPGTHQITVVSPSQKSMKAVLRGGQGVLSPADLKKFDWRFPERSVSAEWFESKEHDEPDPGETLLYYVGYHGTAGGTLTLEYQVVAETAPMLGGRSLVVGHDGSARHMIRGHLLPLLYLFGWGLMAWGVLWMSVQLGVALKARRLRPSGPEAS